MNSSYSAYLGGIGGWWLAGFFHLPWMAWMPAFPSSDATAMMILFCTSFLLIGLDEVCKAIRGRPPL